MPHSCFELVMQQFELQIETTRELLVEPVVLRQPLLEEYLIRWGLERVTPRSNERTRCETIVGQMMLSVALEVGLHYFPGYPFEVDPELGLVGECDYLLGHADAAGAGIAAPVRLIVEVNRELERCLPVCLVELIAAQRFNGDPQPVYGVLSTGSRWQFLKLEGHRVTLEQKCYRLEPIESIAGILVAMAGQI